MSDSSTADQPKEPTVLTPKQIKDACPGCTNDFVVQCIEDELTIEQCGRRHVENLAKQNATLKAERDEANAKALAAEDELAKAKAEAESAATTKSGVEGLKESQTSEASESSATDEFWQAVGELEAKGMARHEAIAKVHKRNPELRQAMLAEINA